MAPEYPTPTVEEHEPAPLDDTVQDEPTTEDEEAAVPPVRAEAPAAKAAPSPPIEQEQAGRTKPRERDRAESPRGAAPSAESADAQATVSRKTRSGAIWQEEAPSVREGLRVGPSTPLPAAERTAVAPPPRAAPGAADGIRKREERQLEQRAPVDALRIERARPLRATAESKAKATHQSDLQEVDAVDAAPNGEAMRQKADRERSTMAVPAAPVGAAEAPRRENSRKVLDDGRLSFIVTGVNEERVRAILTTEREPVERKRDRSVPAMPARRATLRGSVAVAQPVVTHLADGRVSILATVQSADLPAILTALGKEGTVRPSRGQLMRGRDDGMVLLEFVLTP